MAKSLICAVFTLSTHYGQSTPWVLNSTLTRPQSQALRRFPECRPGALESWSIVLPVRWKLACCLFLDFEIQIGGHSSLVHPVEFGWFTVKIQVAVLWWNMKLIPPPPPRLRYRRSDRTVHSKVNSNPVTCWSAHLGTAKQDIWVQGVIGPAPHTQEPSPDNCCLNNRVATLPAVF